MALFARKGSRRDGSPVAAVVAEWERDGRPVDVQRLVVLDIDAASGALLWAGE
jgi:hypothetical protein